MPVLLETGYHSSPALQSGAREDLSNLISNVDAKSTVFSSLAKKGKKPGNVVMGWQMDKYADAVNTGIFEATDVADTDYVNPGVARKLMQNYVQIFRRSFRISNLADQVQVVAGVKSELANGIAKKLVELKRDMELAFLGNTDADAESGTQNPYTTKGLGSFLHVAGTNTSTDDFIPAGYLCPTGSIETTATASLTEAKVQDVLKSIYNTTGTIRDYDLLVGPTLKRVFTNFTQSVAAASSNERLAIKSFNQSAESKSFINVIDVYEGDFGRLRLHPTTHISTTAPTGSGTAKKTHGVTPVAAPFKGYIIPFDKAEIRYGKLPQIKELTDNGGGPARMIEAMAALVIHNPSAFGFFNGAS
jgi:hypothetical protein